MFSFKYGGTDLAGLVSTGLCKVFFFPSLGVFHVPPIDKYMLEMYAGLPLEFHPGSTVTLLFACFGYKHDEPRRESTKGKS